MSGDIDLRGNVLNLKGYAMKQAKDIMTTPVSTVALDTGIKELAFTPDCGGCFMAFGEKVPGTLRNLLLSDLIPG